MSIIKLWFAGTALVLVAAMIWSFAPVLVPMIGLTVLLGGFVAGIVALARRIESRRLRAAEAPAPKA